MFSNSCAPLKSTGTAKLVCNRQVEQDFFEIPILAEGLEQVQSEIRGPWERETDGGPRAAIERANDLPGAAISATPEHPAHPNGLPLGAKRLARGMREHPIRGYPYCADMPSGLYSFYGMGGRV